MGRSLKFISLALMVVLMAIPLSVFASGCLQMVQSATPKCECPDCPPDAAQVQAPADDSCPCQISSGDQSQSSAPQATIAYALQRAALLQPAVDLVPIASEHEVVQEQPALVETSPQAVLCTFLI